MNKSYEGVVASGILSQDFISLTENLDGVRFRYLATSSGKFEQLPGLNTTPNIHTETQKSQLLSLLRVCNIYIMSS